MKTAVIIFIASFYLASAIEDSFPFKMKPYELKYQTDDHSRHETGNPGQSVQGQYSFNKKTGGKVMVKYVADQGGFRVVDTDGIELSQNPVLQRSGVVVSQNPVLQKSGVVAQPQVQQVQPVIFRDASDELFDDIDDDDIVSFVPQGQPGKPGITKIVTIEETPVLRFNPAQFRQGGGFYPYPGMPIPYYQPQPVQAYSGGKVKKQAQQFTQGAVPYPYYFPYFVPQNYDFDHDDHDDHFDHDD